MADAKQVLFLGFGWAEDNLKLLRLTAADNVLSDECKAYGTALGLVGQECDDAVRRVGMRRTGQNRLEIVNTEDDCHVFLRRIAGTFTSL